MDVPHDAAALPGTVFPDLTAEQRGQILEPTATDSGYPLDLTGDGGPSRQRIDLAAGMAADVEVTADGSVTVTGFPDANEGERRRRHRDHRGRRAGRRVRPGGVHVRRGPAGERAGPGRGRRGRRARRAGADHQWR
ncbi:hypothetical protein GCM10010238_31060 [Streptomyces griseoviridis]|uniref:Uncharacterized protein n=1 Tax=Streptomyces griseoviridis TaxID=45398 RepID=A0A918LEQ6_STRGD|nr:hypothetical protein GCM10010238_31060 [Streptomyces niveoruber]